MPKESSQSLLGTAKGSAVFCSKVSLLSPAALLAMPQPERPALHFNSATECSEAEQLSLRGSIAYKVLSC